MYRSLLLTFTFLLLVGLSSLSQDFDRAGILFYNVENLFNPDKEDKNPDEEFSPKGSRRWTHFRKNVKLANISKVILYAGQWNPPVLVGVCEVEDRSVVNDLVENTGLYLLNYSVVHFDSPDPRGIDVALLYRSDRFSVIKAYPVKVGMPEVLQRTRDILYVSGVIDQIDTLHVLVNHWPSRRGGVGASKPKRMVAANTLKDICDSILSVSPQSKIIAMGDFNDEPGDNSLLRVSRKPGAKGPGLVNLAWRPKGDVPGTIKHGAYWACFDQILVSSPLLNCHQESYCLEDSVMHILSPQFLLEEDSAFPGVKPYRTYLGYKYRKGFSDHLPVMIELKREKDCN
ncbi:endonuclease/exonuclease/phosphatase family protein [Thermophagus sp. OGC60D27]|uniref:endonuclease/exonuclease/phosphatase family protein n=1 Tax=Thermophagus sp. OGC60D27 TaxID=3458415 RepID=UPI004037C853